MEARDLGMSEVEVSLGQRWRDRDKRVLSGNRVLVIKELTSTHAILYDPRWPLSKPAKVRFDNLRKRWELQP
jgi:hypothetical protein